MSRHHRFALVALILTLPIALMLSSIVFGITFIEAALKSVLMNLETDQPNVLGRIFMLGALLALPVSLVVTIWPMIKARKMFTANLLVLALVVALMIPTWGALSLEIYRCDILQIPNCD